MRHHGMLIGSNFLGVTRTAGKFRCAQIAGIDESHKLGRLRIEGGVTRRGIA